MTQETFLTAFVEGVQTTAERYIQISQFDKTIEATVIEKKSGSDNIYYVSSYGCNRFMVSTLSSDNTLYHSGDQVYVSLPNGDYNGTNKYIIGKIDKVTPRSVVRQKDDYLVQNYLTYTGDLSNKKQRQMIIMEFDAYVDLSNVQIPNSKKVIAIKENFITFELYGKDFEDRSKYITKKIIWSTNSLYGNIFDNLFMNKQKIIISNVDTLASIGIKRSKTEHNLDDFSISVELLGLNQEILGTANLRISNIACYIGYEIERLEQHNISNTSILLTEKGYILFHKKDDIWSETTLAELQELEPKYSWSISWYNYNPLQEKYSTSSPIPQYWDLLEDYVPKNEKDYKYKLILLTATEQDNNTKQKNIYSILE